MIIRIGIEGGEGEGGGREHVKRNRKANATHSFNRQFRKKILPQLLTVQFITYTVLFQLVNI